MRKIKNDNFGKHVLEHAPMDETSVTTKPKPNGETIS